MSHRRVTGTAGRPCSYTVVSVGVLSAKEVESVAHGYLLGERHVGDKYVGNAIFQIVIPTRLGDGILRT